MPMTATSERRRYPRFHGSGLIANIGGRLVRVVGISAGGMVLETGFAVVGGVMRFTLYPSDGAKVEINKGVGGTCRLVRHEKEAVVVCFEPANYRLVKLVAEWAQR